MIRQKNAEGMIDVAISALSTALVYAIDSNDPNQPAIRTALRTALELGWLYDLERKFCIRCGKEYDPSTTSASLMCVVCKMGAVIPTENYLKTTIDFLVINRRGIYQGVGAFSRAVESAKPDLEFTVK